MILNVFLPVTYEAQGPFYLCGPACINMVLSRWGKNYNQLDVWTDVQNNTVGVRPGDAPTDAGSFSSQSCDLCSSKVLPDGSVENRYSCWYTSPHAMAATIGAAAPAYIRADIISDYQDAIRRLADSIATYSTPAVFTTPSNLHWVVAYGYQHNDAPSTTLSYVKWNGQYITGVFVLNPNPASAPSGDLTMITPRGLMGLIQPIDCGTDAGKYPVVGGGWTGPVGKLAAVAWMWLALIAKWIDPRIWRRYLRRRPPGPPQPPA